MAETNSELTITFTQRGGVHKHALPPVIFFNYLEFNVNNDFKSWAWTLLTLLILFSMGAGLWVATKKIDYNWRWNRVPQLLFFITMRHPLMLPQILVLYRSTVSVKKQQ